MTDELSNLYQNVFHQAITACIIVTEAGIVRKANPAACSLFGYNSDELVGSNFNSFLTSQSDSPLIKSKKPSQLEATGISKNGDHFNCKCSLTTLKNEKETIKLLQITEVYDKKSPRKVDLSISLMESVVTNTTDSIMVTLACDSDLQFPEIIYVNSAFTEMTGFTPDDVCGGTIDILEGPNTDKQNLQKLKNAFQKQNYTEEELLYYKKSGKEIWVKLSLIPVFDDGGTCSHFILIKHDITERKNRELIKTLQSDISRLFNEQNSLSDTIDAVLEIIVEFGSFSLSEIWLVDENKSSIGLKGFKTFDESIQKFYDDSKRNQLFREGEGMPGITWQKDETLFWQNIGNHEHFLRREAAKNSDIKTAYCIPIRFNNEVTGVLLLGVNENIDRPRYYMAFLQQLGEDLGDEIKRKQLEEELNRTFNFSTDIICISGMDGYFKKVNPALSRMLGYTQDELLSHPISSFTHPDDRMRTELEIDAINRGEGSIKFENRFLTKSGKVIWLSWATQTFYEEGKIYSIGRDITEQKKLELLLDQASKLSKIGSWELDLVENKVYWSEVVYNIFGVATDFVPTVENNLAFYKEGENRQNMWEVSQKAIENGTPWDIEVLILTQSGDEKWVRSIGEAEFTEGRCTRLYGSLQDINKRKVAELAYKNALEERTKILDSISDAFFAVDNDWTVTYWNNVAENVLNMPRGEIVGKNLWDVYEDAKELEFYDQYHKAMKEQETVHFEAYYPSTKKWLEVNVYPSESGLSVFFRDVTGRKEAEQRLKELNRSLEKQTKELAISNAELEQFAFVASHDLQEPLRMVTSFLALLEKKYGENLDDKAKKYINFATDGAKRMRQIIHDLLDFSKVGRVETELTDIDINDVLDDVIILNRTLIKEKNASVTWEKMPVIYASQSQMQQLFQNLVRNALNYQDPGNKPIVRIWAEESESYWKFFVKDNGIGINMEYSDKIFQIFQRLHNSEEYSGTGVGLAICKKIVEDSGGSIGVDSAEGKGSTFFFTYPKHKI